MGSTSNQLFHLMAMSLSSYSSYSTHYINSPSSPIKAKKKLRKQNSKTFWEHLIYVFLPLLCNYKRLQYARVKVIS